MSLIKRMYNRNIVNKIREIIPTYRYNSISEFYKYCKNIHKDIVHEAITKSIENNFEIELKLSKKYPLSSTSLYEFTGQMTPYGGSVDIYVHYYDDNDFQFIDLKLNDNGLFIFLNLHYVSDYINKYEHQLRTQLFYLEFCLSYRVKMEDINTYVHHITNDINISSSEFLFITRMISLLSPSEKINRKDNVKNLINEMKQHDINLICYGNHGFKRVCCLINHLVDSSYYNLFYFFLFHFMDEDTNEIKPVFYLGYYLTKLNINDFGIDKEYIEKIKNLDYKLSRRDMQIAKKVYNFFDNYFNEYIYDFYKIIDSELDKKHEYNM